MGFSVKGRCKYALRIFVGRINAVSGLLMGDELPHINDKEIKQDYVIVPQQRWVDGICVMSGVVRQFVAMPRECISLFSYILHGAFKGICTSFPRIDANVAQDGSFEFGTYKPSCSFATCHCS